MKAKWNVLFALAAALAAGCSDGSDSAWEEGSPSAPAEIAKAEAALVEVAAEDVEELLRGIGPVSGNSSFNIGWCYWDFAGGTLDADGDGGCTFTVQWVNKYLSTNVRPVRATTLSSMREASASTALLAVDFSGAEWKTEPSTVGNVQGKIMARIELAAGAKGKCSIPESLQSVIIALESSEKWINN